MLDQHGRTIRHAYVDDVAFIPLGDAIDPNVNPRRVTYTKYLR